MANYSSVSPHHSVSIARAKATTERLGSSYSSNQLISLLDTLLFNALAPLVEHTKYLDAHVANLIALSYGKKRKISSHAVPDKAYSRLSVFLLSGGVRERQKALRLAKLDRGFYFAVLDQFFQQTKEYTQMLADCENDLTRHRYAKRAKLHEIEKRVAAGPDLLLAITNARFWYEEASEFKRMLAEKYLRHAVNNAVKLNGKRGFFNIELDDVIQNHALAVSKAIDKFDPTKGTLTAYINTWFMDARNNKNHLIVTPNTVSMDSDQYGDGDDTEDSSSFDPSSCSPCPTHAMERQEEINEIRWLARYADPTGVGRFSLGIEEILTDQEYALLRGCAAVNINKQEQ